MSVFEKNNILRGIKNILKGTLFRPGSIVTIIRGPLKGCRYVANEDSGWAPIYGGWEEIAVKLFQQFIKSKDIVYDLGANTGIHSLLFSKIVGSEGCVFAFEPLPENAKAIKSIIKLNDLCNVKIIERAVSNKSGQYEFKKGQSNKQGSLVGIGCESGESITVNITTLDEIILGGTPAPTFIKMDIEGAESMALEGFEQHIDEVKPIFYIELHSPSEDLKVGTYLKKHHYRVYRPDFKTKAPSRAEFVLREVERYDLGWPSQEGVWGNIIAAHESQDLGDVPVILSNSCN